MLLAAIVVALSAVLPAVGSAISDQLGRAGCPPGWDLLPAGPTKNNGSDADANGDGVVCQKQIPGQGQGNTGNNNNIKDNNQGGP